jgi:hypothetical protein
MAEESKARKPSAARRSTTKRTAAKTKAAPTRAAGTRAKTTPAKTTRAKTTRAKTTPAKTTRAKAAAAPKARAATPKAKTATRKTAAKKPAARKSPATTRAAAPRRAPTPPPEEEFIPTAPSLGPDMVIEHVRLAKHEQSELDAMGKDKRREVVGQTYGPTVARQVTLYGVFLAILAALVFGGKALTDKLDEPPASNPDKAPWSQPDAKQIPPKPIQ